MSVSLGKMRTETEEDRVLERRRRHVGGERREGRVTHHTTHPSTPTAGHINTNDLCLRTAYLLDEVPHQPHHAGGVRAAVDEVAHEDQPPPLGVRPVAVVTEAVQELAEGAALSMDVADDVDGALEEGLEHGGSGRGGGGG